jgi:hypothetical protein
MNKEVIKQKISDLKAQSRNVNEASNQLLADIEATIKEIKEIKVQDKTQKMKLKT